MKFCDIANRKQEFSINPNAVGATRISRTIEKSSSPADRLAQKIVPPNSLYLLSMRQAGALVIEDCTVNCESHLKIFIVMLASQIAEIPRIREKIQSI